MSRSTNCVTQCANATLLHSGSKSAKSIREAQNTLILKMKESFSNWSGGNILVFNIAVSNCCRKMVVLRGVGLFWKVGIAVGQKDNCVVGELRMATLT